MNPSNIPSLVATEFPGMTFLHNGLDAPVIQYSIHVYSLAWPDRFFPFLWGASAPTQKGKKAVWSRKTRCTYACYSQRERVLKVSPLPSPTQEHSSTRPIPRGGSRGFVQTPFLMGRILFSV